VIVPDPIRTGGTVSPARATDVVAMRDANVSAKRSMAGPPIWSNGAGILPQGRRSATPDAVDRPHCVVDRQSITGWPAELAATKTGVEPSYRRQARRMKCSA